MSLDERTVVACEERLTLRQLRVWIREGWVRPAIGEQGPVFDEVDLARVRLLCDLSKDMALPNDTLPVVLNLIDRLHQTRRDLSCLANAVDRQPDRVRSAIVTAFQMQRDGDDE